MSRHRILCGVFSVTLILCLSACARAVPEPEPLDAPLVEAEHVLSVDLGELWWTSVSAHVAGDRIVLASRPRKRSRTLLIRIQDYAGWSFRRFEIPVPRTLEVKPRNFEIRGDGTGGVLAKIKEGADMDVIRIDLTNETSKTLWSGKVGGQWEDYWATEDGQGLVYSSESGFQVVSDGEVVWDYDEDRYEPFGFFDGEFMIRGSKTVTRVFRIADRSQVGSYRIVYGTAGAYPGFVVVKSPRGPIVQISKEDWAPRSFTNPYGSATGPHSLGRSVVLFEDSMREALVFNTNGVFRFALPEGLLYYGAWKGRIPNEIVLYSKTGLECIQVQDPRIEF